MKKIKLFTLSLLLVCLSGLAYSQISVAPQASFVNFFGGTEIRSFGLGIKGEYATSDRFVPYGGVNFYFPNKSEGYATAVANDFNTTPSYIDVATSEKLSFIHLMFGAKFYFVGDYEDDFNFYGFGEAGYLLARYTEELTGNYDRQKYTLEESSYGETESFGNFTIAFGLGIEKDLDFGYLFFDTKLILPANNVNGQVVDISIPASIGLNAGLRFPF